MAYIIKSISPVSGINSGTKILSCMHKCKINSEFYYDSERILDRINKAAVVKEQLSAENTERNNSIKQKANYAKLNKLV